MSQVMGRISSYQRMALVVEHMPNIGDLAPTAISSGTNLRPDSDQCSVPFRGRTTVLSTNKATEQPYTATIFGGSTQHHRVHEDEKASDVHEMDQDLNTGDPNKLPTYVLSQQGTNS